MKHLLLATLVGFSFQSFAVTSTYFESLDVKAVHDEEVMFEQKGVAPRFAVPHEVNVEPVLEKSGTGSTFTS